MAEKKQYADFTLVITYTHKAAAKRGKPTQTHRDDLTRLNYIGKHMKVEGLHPLYVLYMKFLEEKPFAYAAKFFDNRREKGFQQVCHFVIDKGVQREYGNRLDEYFDMETGKPQPGTAAVDAILNAKKV